LSVPENISQFPVECVRELQEGKVLPEVIKLQNLSKLFLTLQPL